MDKRQTMTQNQNSTKQLYCVAYERRVGKTWHAALEYMHAKDITEARLHFGGTFMNKGSKGAYGKLMGNTVRLVGIAPAFGAFALDRHAEKLIV